MLGMPRQASCCGHRAVSMLKLTDMIRISIVWELDGAEPEPNYLELSLVSFIAHLTRQYVLKCVNLEP